MKQFTAWWRFKRKSYPNTFYFKEKNGQDGLFKVANTIFLWLDANYKLIYKLGHSLPWLNFPHTDQINETFSQISPLNEDSNTVTNSLPTDNEMCSDCRKDLIDILICFLYQGINRYIDKNIEGKIIAFSVAHSLNLRRFK